MALFSCVPQIAIKMDIPLILWGENPGLQLGDLKTLGTTGYDGNNLRLMNTLDGASLLRMLEALDLLETNFIPYPIPNGNRIHRRADKHYLF